MTGCQCYCCVRGEMFRKLEEETRSKAEMAIDEAWERNR